MLRKFRTLTIALAALFAIGAIASSAASAISFHSTAEESTLTGESVEVNGFVVDTGVVLCQSAQLTGTQEGEEAEVMVLHPTYEECEMEGLFEVSVNTNECDYVFTPTNYNEAEEGYDVTLDIVNCGANPYIQIGSTINCRVRIGEQESLFGAIFKAFVKFVVKVVKAIVHAIDTIEYTEEGLFCAGAGGNNGTFTGSDDIVANGEEDELWIE